jgi:glycosyltransferase involved in cell wall biosynthesis
MPPLRIIHMTPTQTGAPWMVAFLIEQKKLGHDVRAFIPSADGDIAPKLDAAGIPYDVLATDLFGSHSVFGAARTILSCARLLRKRRPDVLQTHIFESTILGRLASWIADVPIRISMIPGPLVLELPLMRLWDLATAFADHKIVASCEHTRTLYRDAGIDPSKLELVYYAVDQSAHDPALADGAKVRRDLGVSPDSPLIGFIAYFYGPLAPNIAPPHLRGRGVKGHDVLIRAVPGVLQSFPDARFAIVGKRWGDYPSVVAYENYLHQLVEDLGVGHAVIFTGERRDVPDVLASLDISVHCSLNDNLGGTVESLLMERPMVTSDIGGFRDTILHERTGLLVPVDDPPALADAIVRLLRDPVFAKRLGEAGRAWMLERFTLSRSIADLEELYARCAAPLTVNGRAPRESGYRLGTGFIRLASLPAKLFPVLRATRVLLGRGPGLMPRVLTRVLKRIRPTGSAPSGAKLRIAQVIGAAQNCQWAVDLGAGLQDRGHEVVGIIDSAEGSLGDAFEMAGMRVRRVPLAFATRLDRTRMLAFALHFPAAVWRLSRVLREERIDVAQAHIFPSILLSRAAALLARIPHVSMISGPRHLEAKASRLTDRFTWWMDTRTVAGCDYTHDIYAGMGLSPERLTRIYYGADDSRFDPARADGARIRREFRMDDDAPVVTIVANFYPPVRGFQAPRHTRGAGIKGHEDFFAAARIVAGRFPDAKFLVVGSGVTPPGEAYRQSLIAGCERDAVLAPRVVFTGKRADVADILAATSVAVQCSITENLGGTIEALLMVCPTVATNVGGMPEAVVHELTGLIVPPSDPVSLSSAILRLLENREEAQAFGRRGRAKMLRDFTLAPMVEAVDQVLGSAAERSS